MSHADWLLSRPRVSILSLSLPSSSHIWLDDAGDRRQSPLSRQSANGRISARFTTGRRTRNKPRCLCVHLRRRLRRHVLPGSPRINSLDPLSLDRVSLSFSLSLLPHFNSSLHHATHTRTYTHHISSSSSFSSFSTSSSSSWLDCSLSLSLSLSLSCSIPLLLLPGFLPCVSLSLRTHLPAERGRTCSTVALRTNEPRAPPQDRQDRASRNIARGRIVNSGVVFLFFFLLSFFLPFLSRFVSARFVVQSAEGRKNRGTIIREDVANWRGALLAYFRSRRSLLPLSLSLFFPSSASYGCASRYSEIARGSRLRIDSKHMLDTLPRTGFSTKSLPVLSCVSLSSLAAPVSSALPTSSSRRAAGPHLPVLRREATCHTGEPSSPVISAHTVTPSHGDVRLEGWPPRFVTLASKTPSSIPFQDEAASSVEKNVVSTRGSAKEVRTSDNRSRGRSIDRCQCEKVERKPADSWLVVRKSQGLREYSYLLSSWTVDFELSVQSFVNEAKCRVSSLARPARIGITAV